MMRWLICNLFCFISSFSISESSMLNEPSVLRLFKMRFKFGRLLLAEPLATSVTRGRLTEMRTDPHVPNAWDLY
ncbi:hypothetical protein V8C42DRAFT_337494 [Trichoderma barbatum]